MTLSTFRTSTLSVARRYACMFPFTSVSGQVIDRIAEQLPSCPVPVPRVRFPVTLLVAIVLRIDAVLTSFRTREDVVLPLSEPIRGRDGTMMSEVPIPKDTSVFVGIYTSNTRKALWGDDAYEWKPERWLSRLPDAVLDAKIPGVYSNLCVSRFGALIGRHTERIWM